MADWGIQAAEGLEHAHQLGVVHRDIKPSNLMVNSEGHLWITDFGLAQIQTDVGITMTGDILGTLRYMSPEQAQGNRRVMDHRTDIYSLGVTLYELLVLRSPFQSGDRHVLIHEIVDGDPPSLRQINRLIPRDLETIVLKAIATEPQGRYATAQEMADDLKRFVADEPIRARRPALTDRTAKWARRHRPLVWSALSFLALSMIGLAASTLLIAREQTRTANAYESEKEQRKLAEEQEHIAHGQERIAREQERIAREQTLLANRQRDLAKQQSAEAVRQRDAARQNLYYADMRLSFVDIGLGNAGRARGSLLNHLPTKDEPDRRGWEWYYLLGRSHEAEQALYGHGSEISNVAWSPDGNSIASVGADGSARVWDTKTWRLLRRFDQGETFKNGVGWSPDNGKLAWGSCGNENALRIWDRRSDAISILLGHKHSIWAVAWSHDGRYVATAGIESPGNVRIWNIAEKKCVRELAATGNPRSVDWSPDDRLLAATGGTLSVWNASSGDVVYKDTQLSASHATWHPSQARLAVGRYDGECLIWDQAERKTVLRWKAHKGEVTATAWSPDGRQLLSAGGDGMVKVWDTEGHEQKSVAAHEGLANSVAWDPSGKRFASSGSDGVIRIWNAENRPNPLVVSTKLKGDFNLAWDSQSTGLFLASAGNGKIVAWDTSSGKKLEEIPLPQNEDRRLVSFRHVLERTGPPSAGPARPKVTGLPASGILNRVVAPSALNGGWNRNDAVLSPDRTRIAYLSGFYSERPTVLHLPTGRITQCPEVTTPCGAAWSPDGRHLAVVGHGESSDGGNLQWAGWLHIFDADSGSRLRKLKIGTERIAGTAVAWSYDGRKIVAGSGLGLCEVWEVSSGRKLVSVRIQTSEVSDLAWSLDDLRLASGGVNGHVGLWDPATGEQLLALEPGTAPIRHIRWSPDGRKLAAVSDDGVIKVWDATAGYELPRRDFWRHLIELRERKRFERLIDEQRWPQAADVLKRLIATRVQDAYEMYQLALLSLQLDDRAGYRDVCNRMLSTFADAGNPYWVAWTCSLAPDAIEDWPKAVASAEKAAKADPRSPQYQNTFGATLYRAGRFDESLQRLTEADRLAQQPEGSDRPSPAYTWFFLAMAHQRLGHREEAKKWLDKAAAWTEKTIHESAQGIADLPWNRRLTLKLLREEAEASLKSAPAPQSPKPAAKEEEKPK